MLETPLCVYTLLNYGFNEFCSAQESVAGKSLQIGLTKSAGRNTFSQMAIQYQHALDRTFHALGDGTRRAIISMLADQGALSAGEICAPFNAAQPTISKHLKVLEQAGLIKREVDGRTHRFEVRPNPMREAEDWLKRHQAFWEGTLEQLDNFVRTAGQPEKKA